LGGKATALVASPRASRSVPQCACGFGSAGRFPRRSAKLPSCSDRTERVTRNVLMVDDSEIVAESTRRMLKREGFEVVVAQNCAEAKAAVAEHRFCAHIIDLELEDGRGVDLALWLRREGHEGPTIFYTGHGMGSEALEQARQFGRVVTKGGNVKGLTTALRELVPSLRPPAKSKPPGTQVRSFPPRQSRR